MIPFERRRPPRAAFVFFFLCFRPFFTVSPFLTAFPKCFPKCFPKYFPKPSPPPIPTSFLLLISSSILPRGGCCSLHTSSAPELLFSFFTSGWDSPHPEVVCVHGLEVRSTISFVAIPLADVEDCCPPMYFRSAERVCVVAPYALRLRYLEHCNYASYLPRGGRCSLHTFTAPELLFSFFTSGWDSPHPEVEGRGG